MTKQAPWQVGNQACILLSLIMYFGCTNQTYVPIQLSPCLEQFSLFVQKFQNYLFFFCTYCEHSAPCISGTTDTLGIWGLLMTFIVKKQAMLFQSFPMVASWMPGVSKDKVSYSYGTTHNVDFFADIGDRKVAQMSICHSLSKMLPVHCLYLQHVFNVNILSIFYTLPKSKMLLESHVLYLLKWKSHPVFPNCCREKTQLFSPVFLFRMCVLYYSHRTLHFRHSGRQMWRGLSSYQQATVYDTSWHPTS